MFSSMTTKALRPNFRIWKYIPMLLILLSASMGLRAQTGGALNFTDGDYVNLGTSIGNFGLGDFTIETWFKTSMSNGTLIGKRATCNVSPFWNIRISSGKIRMEMMEAGGNNAVDISTPLTYNDNQWHHVAVVRTGTLVRIIMDGSDAIITSEPITFLNNADPLKLGQSACNNYIGLLDETRIWNTDIPFCTIYNRSKYEYQSTSTSLLFSAHYNQGVAGGTNTSVTSLTNSSSNGTPGTLVSFALSGSTSNWVSSTCPAQGETSPFISVETVSSCGPYTWENTIYPSSGTFQKLLVAANGCDSQAQLVLTVNPVQSISTITNNATICAGKGNTIAAVNSNPPVYCTPTTTSSSSGNDYISLFGFGGINNSSGDGPGAYNYYGTQNAFVTAGVSSSMFMTFDATFQQGVAVWVDLNQDGDFIDANELVLSVAPSSFGPFANITIPTSAYNGYTRMRVACRRGATPTAGQSCGGFDFGEFEDYNLVITGGVPNPNYNYTWAPSTNLSNTTQASVTTTNMNSSTTYTVTLTDANGCSATATQTVSVNPKPTAPIITSESNKFCQGDTVSMSLTPSYCSPTVSGSNVTNQHFISQFLFDGQIQSITGEGPSSYNNYSNQVANVSAGNSYSYLLGHGGTASTGKAIWIDFNLDCDFGDAGELVVSTTSNTSSAGGNITIPGTAFNGIARMRVAVSSGSQPNSGQSCSGFSLGEYEDYSLNISGGLAALTWQPSSPLIVSNGSPVYIVNQGVITTYTLTVSDANGCTNTGTKTIQYFAKPSITVTASNNTPCSNSLVTLTANGASSYSWSNGINNGVPFNASSTATYTVTGTDANGCSATVSKTITVLPNPTINNIKVSGPVCPGGSNMLTTLNYCSPTTYPSNIYDSTYTIKSFNFNNGQINNNVQNSTTYSNFSYITANVTAGASYPISITTPNIHPLYFLCLLDANQDGTFDLSTEVLAGVQTPTTNNLTGAFTIPATTKNGYVRLRMLVASHNFGLQSNCIIADYVNQTNQAYGEFEDYTLIVSGGSAAPTSSITWSPSSNLSSSTGHTVLASNLTSSTTYTATITDGNGCTATTTSTAIVNANPTVSITSSTTNVCVGQSVTLTANGAVQYSWNNNVTNGIAFVPAATNTYSVIGSNAQGCTASSSVVINVHPYPVVPPLSSSGFCSGQSGIISISIAYCTPVFTSNQSNSNYIDTFSIGGTSLQSYSGKSNNGYMFNPNSVTNLSAFLTYNFILSGDNSSNGVKSIWIDYNQNGSFTDAGEHIFGSTSTANTVSATFSIPTTASQGITRMRVLIGNSTTNTIANSSCSGVSSGEYEDYWINISGGVNTMVWSPSGSFVNYIGGRVQTTPINSNTTFTVTVTDANGCSQTSTLLANPSPSLSVSASASSNLVCIGESFQLNAVPTSGAAIVKDSLLNSSAAVTFNSGFTFDIINGNKAITITSFKIKSSSGSLAEVWYKPGGYGSTSFISNNGWTKLGNTIPYTASVSSNFVSLPLSDSLEIPAGETYGIIIITNGSLYGSFGTQPGLVYSSNADLAITQGHTGTGFGGNFSFQNAPRIWSGEVVYHKGPIASYNWQPDANIIHPNHQASAATISANTTFTVTVTDINNCSSSDTVIVNSKSTPALSVNTPNSIICEGDSKTVIASGGTNYSWQPGNLPGSSINVSPSVSTIYTVSSTNALGCTGYATASIQVRSAPVPFITSSNNAICTGSAVQLNVTLLPLRSTMSNSIIIQDNTTASPYPATVSVGNGYQQNLALKRVYINGFTHTYPTDIDMWLMNPSGQIVMLMSDVGGSEDLTNFNIVFEDNQTPMSANPLINGASYAPTNSGVNGTNEPFNPYTQLSSFTGSHTGIWQLFIRDDANNDSGSVFGFQLEFEEPDSSNYSISWLATPSTSMSNMNPYQISTSPLGTTVYQTTVTDANGCTSSAIKLIDVDTCGSDLTVKLFIQGYYAGTQTMVPVKLNEGIGSSLTAVDDIQIELRQALPPYAVVASVTTLLQTNGNAVATFNAISSGSYYVVIKHRNALETWSASPLSIQPNSTYDFSSSDTKAFGGNQIEVEPGVWALYSGDMNQDLVIDVFDYLILEPDVIAGNSGYLVSDTNGDGSVDAFDYLTIEMNIINGVSSVAP